MNYFSLGIEAFNAVKQTPVLAHADEFETSLYLYLAPERVGRSERWPTTTWSANT